MGIVNGVDGIGSKKDGSIHLEVFILDLNDKITITATIQPVSALRCIEISVPRYIYRRIKCLHSLDYKKAFVYLPNSCKKYSFPLCIRNDWNDEWNIKEHYNNGKYYMRKGSNAKL